MGGRIGAIVCGSEALKNQLNRASKEIVVDELHAAGHFALLHEKSAIRVFQNGLRGQLRLIIKSRNYQDFHEA